MMYINSSFWSEKNVRERWEDRFHFLMRSEFPMLCDSTQCQALQAVFVQGMANLPTSLNILSAEQWKRFTKLHISSCPVNHGCRQRIIPDDLVAKEGWTLAGLRDWNKHIVRYTKGTACRTAKVIKRSSVLRLHRPPRDTAVSLSMPRQQSRERRGRLKRP